MDKPIVGRNVGEDRTVNQHSGDSPNRGKRVLVLQVTSLYPNWVPDGAQAILLNLLRHLSRVGVKATVYCMGGPDNRDEYELFPGVLVRPHLRFNEDHWDPYAAPPPHLSDVIDTLRRAAAEHDLCYIHDSHLRFAFLTNELPTVYGLCDLRYGPSATAALNFERDRLLTISDYLAGCVRELLAPLRPGAATAVHVAHSGFDTRVFKPTESALIRARLRLSQDAVPLLYPHRAEAAKGIYDALAAVNYLRDRISPAIFERIRILLPMRPHRPTSPHMSEPEEQFHRETRHRAAELGLSKVIHWHDWIAPGDLPAYYSLGVATLCVGVFPEAFGNVHIESLLCGTPTVISRVAAQRGTVPDELTRKVDAQAPEEIADHLEEILQENVRVDETVRYFLADTYGAHRALPHYERVLLECERVAAPPLAPLRGRPDAAARLRIPTWAARLRRGYYHDYLGYVEDARLTACLPLAQRGCTVADLQHAAGVTAAEVRAWLRDGLLIEDFDVTTPQPREAGMR